MTDTIVITQEEVETVEVSSPGPQGPPGASSSDTFPTYYQTAAPSSPSSGETWMRIADTYPDQYGAGLFRYDGDAWIQISSVVLDEDGVVLGLMTIGADGNIVLERFVDGVYSSTITLYNGGIFFGVADGAAMGLTSDDVTFYGSPKLRGISEGVDASDAATVSQISGGLTTDAPLTLSAVDYIYDGTNNRINYDMSYDNGTEGVGATITQDDPTDGQLLVDSSNPVNTNRILWADWSTQNRNGIYIVTEQGDGATTPWVLTRTDDCDSIAKRNRYFTVSCYSGLYYALGYASVFAYSNDYPDVELYFSTSVISSEALGGAIVLGNRSFANGERSRANGANNIVSGYNSSTSNDSTSAFGKWLQAYGEASFVTGDRATSFQYGERAHSSGTNGNVSYSQNSLVTCAAKTTDDTPTPLLKQSAENAWTGLSSYESLLVRGRVLAHRTDTYGEDSVWDFEGIARGDGVGNTLSWLGGTPTPSLIAQDIAAAAWDLTIDIVGSELVITVTGETAKEINWHCTLDVDKLF